jgi:hypothetical protein
MVLVGLVPRCDGEGFALLRWKAVLTVDIG